jgi:hypothetical protein
MFIVLFLAGVCMMLIMWHIQRSNHQVFKYHWFNFLNKFRINDGGFADSSDDDGDKGKGIKFTPEQQEFIDKTINSKYSKWKQEEATKYRDYDELQKFKQEHLKAQDAKAQLELEQSKKYDEAKKSYETKINEFGQLVSKKDQEINDLKISHFLTTEIVKQNGYTEETMALIKASAALDSAGNPIIKSKDANGLDISISVADGVKKVLEARPYLVKSTHKSGAGTGSGTGGTGTNTGAGQGADDLMTLNSQMQEAMRVGDWKLQGEIKQKIRQKMASRVGVT